MARYTVTVERETIQEGYVTVEADSVIAAMEKADAMSAGSCDFESVHVEKHSAVSAELEDD